VSLFYSDKTNAKNKAAQVKNQHHFLGKVEQPPEKNQHNVLIF